MDLLLRMGLHLPFFDFVDVGEDEPWMGVGGIVLDDIVLVGLFYRVPGILPLA